MARPFVPRDIKSQPAAISLPPELIRTARQMAHQRGKSLSSLFKELLTLYLADRNGQWPYCVKDAEVSMENFKNEENNPVKE